MCVCVCVCVCSLKEAGREGGGRQLQVRCRIPDRAILASRAAAEHTATRISTRILRLGYRLVVCDSDIDPDIDSDTATQISTRNL